MMELPYNADLSQGDTVRYFDQGEYVMNHITDTFTDIPEGAVFMKTPDGDYLFGITNAD